MAKTPSLKQEIASILACAPAKRAKGIIDSPHTRQILEQLPPQEAYLVIKESWGMDSQILLQYMPAETVCNLIDLDCWDKDSLSVNSVIEWLQELSYTSTDILLETIETIDVEILVMVFQSAFQVVHVRPTDEHIPDLLDEGYESIDNTYFFKVTTEEEWTPFLKDILSVLFTRNHDLYVTILESVMYELPSCLEETSYEKRSLRLMELGFPRPEDALDVYRRVSLDTLLDQGIRKDKTPVVTKHLHMLPDRYIDQFSKAPSVLAEALERANEPTRERFIYEMVYLTNKVVMADYKPLNDAEALRASMEKAGSLCTLGLHVAVRTRGVDGDTVLATTNAETLFSLGYNSVLAVQQRLKRVLDDVERSMLPERVRDIADGLLRKRPLYKEREFSSLEELDEVNREMDRLEAMAAMAKSVDWERSIPELARTNTGAAIDVEAVILTVSAVNSLSGGTMFRPITRDELSGFLTRATVGREKRRAIKDTFRRHLAAYLSSLAPKIDGGLCKDIADILCDRLAEEVGGIADIPSLDPRFITCLCVRL